MVRRNVLLVVGVLLVTACQNTQQLQPPPISTLTPAVATTTSMPTDTPALTVTPQSHLTPVTYGPDASDFPAGVNPLTGRAVQAVSLLKLPAVLVSISNSPVTARPQAGPGFAPWVFELYIGEGATRFMNVFYGDYPRFIPNVTGGCNVRDTVNHPNGLWVGNRVWLDENQNGKQDAWEAGIGGVCVHLRDATGRLISSTSTDSNGYYSFDVAPNQQVSLEFVLPKQYRFTTPNLGDDDTDSDADPETGRTSPFTTASTASYWDAGLILQADVPVATPSIVPPNWFIPSEPYVGPIRSGRLTYNQIGALFPNSCLVYASAARDIGQMLDACHIVYGVDPTTPNSALLTVRQMRRLAEENLNPKQPVNYSGNVFSDTTPPDGQSATSIHIHYHAYAQSGWEYDPISQTYLRYTDQADGLGNLSPATDRLTGRQLAFENVVVLFADYNRFRHNQFEVDLGPGQKGFAYLFRDGQAFKVQWSTLGRGWEKTTGLLRPIYFVDAQNNPIALHPGRTWIHLVTPYSLVTNQGDGRWLMQFVQPDDPLDTPVP